MNHETILLQAGALTAGDRRARRLALIYSGAGFGISFLLTLINFILSRQIDGTGGLAGMGMRSLLSTLQMTLTVISTAVLPFWDMGFYAAALGISRHENVEDGRLLEGFRRFRQVFAFLLLRALFLSILAVVAFYGATMVYMLLPFGDRLLDAMEPVIMSLDPENPDLSALENLYGHLIPLYITAAVAALAFVAPAFYRLRLGEWYVVDTDLRGRQALRASARAMKGNRWELFKLDLQFWWYYLLQLLALAVAYLDLLLPALGVPLNADVAFFLFYTLSLAGQFLLGVFALPRIQVSYALYYNEKRLPLSGELSPKVTEG